MNRRVTLLFVSYYITVPIICLFVPFYIIEITHKEYKKRVTLVSVSFYRFFLILEYNKACYMCLRFNFFFITRIQIVEFMCNCNVSN